MTVLKHGVTTWKVDKAWSGYTVFCPMIVSQKQMHGEKESRVYLIDMKGDICHVWTIPGIVKLHGELLPNGNLLCSVDEWDQPKPFKSAFAVSTIMELDWDSNVVWKYVDPYHDCHDRARLRNGNTLIKTYKPLTAQQQALVKGGVPGTENAGKTMYTLVLKEITPEGNVAWEMDLSEACDPEIDVITPFATRELWPGLNSIEELADGNIMSTSYNTSQIFIWDKENKSVKWRFGQNPGERHISFPHDPQELKNGNIMVFDNGRFYAPDPNGATNNFPPDFSTVVEIDPKTNQVVWEYRAKNPVDFYSTYISSNQRLANGNTLICEGARGRIFEVTQEGETVWEYISPVYTNSQMRFGYTNAIFRAHRYDANYAGLKGKIFDKQKVDQLNKLYGAEAIQFANKLGQ